MFHLVQLLTREVSEICTSVLNWLCKYVKKLAINYRFQTSADI